VSRKEVCYTVDPKAQESRAMRVPPERQNVQSLLDDEITQLAWMGKQIEKHYGQAMDIEWALDKDLPAGGNIFILQARPETVWSARQHVAQATTGGSAMDYILCGMLAGKRVS
jgi:pyruvate,water dikinase